MKDYLYNKVMDYKSDSGIVGYHKCGNTWVSTFLRCYFVQRYDLPEKYMGKIFINDYRVRELFSFPQQLPAIHFTHALTEPEKSALTGTEAFLERFHEKRLVVLTRNIKDILVSSYMHSRYRESPPVFEGGLNEYIHSANWGVRKIVSYYNEIARFRETAPSDTLILHYGDLWKNPEAEFSRLICFLKQDELDSESLKHALEKSSFSNMRKLEDGHTSDKVVIPGLFKASGEGEASRKTRKGGVGGFLQEMSAEEIEYIDEYSRKNLAQYWDAEKFLGSEKLGC